MGVPICPSTTSCDRIYSIWGAFYCCVFPLETTLTLRNDTTEHQPVSYRVGREVPVSIVLYSEPPLIEDHVHCLGQVVHSAVGCHGRVPLIAEPEGGVYA